MEERGLVGLEARATDGEILGRISALITDERSGEVTHVIVERGEEKQIVMPISADESETHYFLCDFKATS